MDKGGERKEGGAPAPRGTPVNNKQTASMPVCIMYTDSARVNMIAAFRCIYWSY